MTSQINPNNIDASYPVAGQPNNTQGFRDNFTAIQTNFQYAENEINDLENKAVLKAALTGTTLDNNMNDALIYAAKIQDFSATAVNITSTAGSIAVNYSAGHYQSITTTGNINVSITNWPIAPTFGYIKLQLVIDSSGRTVTFSGMSTLYGTLGVQGISGNTITFAAAGTYEFAFQTKNGGVTVTMFDLNRPLNYYTNSITTASTITASSSIKSIGTTGGIGYDTGAGGAVTQSIALTGVAITGTAGQFSCTAATQTLVVGDRVTISGTFGGTGSISGYANPTTYYIITTNGSTTFTLSATAGGAAITTTAGTPTGLTYSAKGKTYSVTLNNICGQITTAASVLAAAAEVSFTLTNSAIAATDVVYACVASGATSGAYNVQVDAVAAGSCRVSIGNMSSGSLNEALVLNFVIIKAVAA